jgi:UDPglucose 6-dehydrogenase
VFDDADAVVVATEWPEFGRLDLAGLAPRTRRALIFDGRGLVDPEAAAAAGFAYRGIGRPSRDPVPTLT